MTIDTKRQWGLGHLAHHNGPHFEYVWDFAERQEAIRDKNESAWRMERRLNLFIILPIERLPVDVRTALRAMDEARARLKPLWTDDYWAKVKPLEDDYLAKVKPLEDDYTKRKALKAAIVANESAMNALHTELFPDCPWNGKTIFPRDAMWFARERGRGRRMMELPCHAPSKNRKTEH